MSIQGYIVCHIHRRSQNIEETPFYRVNPVMGAEHVRLNCKRELNESISVSQLLYSDATSLNPSWWSHQCEPVYGVPNRQVFHCAPNRWLDLMNTIYEGGQRLLLKIQWSLMEKYVSVGESIRVSCHHEHTGILFSDLIYLFVSNVVCSSVYSIWFCYVCVTFIGFT